MRAIGKAEWLKELQFGDVVFVRGSGISMAVQNLERKTNPDCDKKASHVALVTFPPLITEADGKIVTGKNSIERYLTNHHKLWIFRPSEFTLQQKGLMAAHIRGAEVSRGTYAIGTWFENLKKYCCHLFGKKYKVKDTPGVVCNEYVWNCLHEARLPNATTCGFALTPSSYLDWFLDVAVPQKWWHLKAYFEKGSYFLLDSPPRTE